MERAKADGRWERAYPGPAVAEVPTDFVSALDRSPIASMRFAQLDRGRRYVIIHQIVTAPSASIRAGRIVEFIARVERDE